MTPTQWREAEEHFQQSLADERERKLNVYVAGLRARRHREQEEERRQRAAMNSGAGWLVLTYPHVPHWKLEKLARGAWDLAFHGTPFPLGWRVRWAELENSYGMCVHAPKLILVDERLNRDPRQRMTTILHELVHVTHPNESHGAGFKDTLERV